jgi:hypothetical protein
MALKNNFLIIILFLFLSSCSGVCIVEPKYTDEAIRLYNQPFVYKANLTQDEIYKIFGGCYGLGDRVYAVQTMYKKKYILVRAGEPYTYADEDTWFGF